MKTERKDQLTEEEFLDMLVQAEKLTPTETYGDEDQDSITELIDSHVDED